MVTKKPRIVIIGAGMAGLTAANKLYTFSKSEKQFDLSVVEGGSRIGGRINTTEFGGDRVEQGATWIHGIEGSPVYKIAQETNSLYSQNPWECMDGILENPVTVAEGGYELNPSLVDPITDLFDNFMDFIQGKSTDEDGFCNEILKTINGGTGSLGVGLFLRRGLEAYWGRMKDRKGDKLVANWSRKEAEEAIFAMHESVQRTFTSAGDLSTLDYNAESEYVMCGGEEITIGKGYSSVIESLASVLPVGMIQLGRKVEKIEWQTESKIGNGNEGIRPVKLHFSDGSTMLADHVIVTVSLGVLKRGIREDIGMFNPPLPGLKTSAISRLGYGVVNKVFLQISPSQDEQTNDGFTKFPFLQMVFHQPDSELKHPKIPQWIRRTSFITPIYSNSRVVLSWFTGQEALELESLTDNEIIEGFSTTVSNFLPSIFKNQLKPNPHEESRNGTMNGDELVPEEKQQLKFDKVLRTQWGNNPLFLGSYSYIAVGSSVQDMDTLAEPLPTKINLDCSKSPPPLQILFAGEATHRTHYSTTHGAYFSGIREANRLLEHYNCVGV